MSGSRSSHTAFPGGVEWFGPPGERDAQCARCGSSVTFVSDESLDGSGGGDAYVCLSGPEWCDAHPIKGREHVKGAGHA